jgi:hypothetical protein
LRARVAHTSPAPHTSPCSLSVTAAFPCSLLLSLFAADYYCTPGVQELLKFSKLSVLVCLLCKVTVYWLLRIVSLFAVAFYTPGVLDLLKSMCQPPQTAQSSIGKNSPKKKVLDMVTLYSACTSALTFFFGTLCQSGRFPRLSPWRGANSKRYSRTWSKSTRYPLGYNGSRGRKLAIHYPSCILVPTRRP